MGVPILIFIVCFSVGTVASGHMLPDLAAGPVGGLAFFVVCGLLGAAFGLLALHIYLIVFALHHTGGFQGLADFKAETVANGIDSILLEAGVLVGLAAGVYLLAPPPEEDEPTASTTLPN